MGNLKYAEILLHKITDCPKSRTVTGYGNKLPTGHMVRVGKIYKGMYGNVACGVSASYWPWRRVYAICCSNVSSLYILIKGEKVFVNELDLEDMLEDGKLKSE